MKNQLNATKIFLTVLISLFCQMAMADFTVLEAKDVINVDVTKAPDRSCKDVYPEKIRVTLTLTTTQKTYVKSFCEYEFPWGNLYLDIYELVEGANTPKCVVSEVCDRYSCSRVYGRTVIDRHDILLKTDSKGRLEDYRKRLRTHCER